MGKQLRTEFNEKKQRELKKYKERIRKMKNSIEKKNKTINGLVDYINKNDTSLTEEPSFLKEEDQERSVFSFEEEDSEANPKYKVKNKITEEAEDEYQSLDGLK